MTRGKYYSVVMPVASIAYVIVGILVGGLAWTIGALCIAIIAVLGRLVDSAYWWGAGYAAVHGRRVVRGTVGWDRK